MKNGIQLSTSRGESLLYIHLGPMWYLERQQMGFEPGDVIEETGARVEIDGEEVMIAKTIRRGQWVLTLRDKTGFPVWSGWRQQR